jgi:phage repressor protein C with HTH and peptisase S24 domain
MVSIPILNAGGRLISLPARLPLINSVAAHRLEHKTDLDYPPGIADRYIELDAKCYALIVEGDCMEPDWHEGEIVIFSPLAIEVRGLQNGDDVALQLLGEPGDDGQNTFKRVREVTEESFVIFSANPKYVDRTMRITWDRVGRLGKAIWAMRSAPRRT